MSVEIRVFKGKSLKEGAEIAIRNRLCVAGWDLRSAYGDILCEQRKESIIFIGYKEGRPIASAALLWDFHSGVQNVWDYMVFVRKQHRRQGIGRQFYQAAKKVRSHFSVDRETSSTAAVFFASVEEVNHE